MTNQTNIQLNAGNAKTIIPAPNEQSPFFWGVVPVLHREEEQMKGWTSSREDSNRIKSKHSSNFGKRR